MEQCEESQRSYSSAFFYDSFYMVVFPFRPLCKNAAIILKLKCYTFGKK